MIAIFNREGHPLTPAMRGSIRECLQYVHDHKVCLDNANLADITLHNASFTDLIIHNACFDNAVLPQATFKNCVFVECQFRNARLGFSTFENCIFKLCDFTEAHLNEALLLSTSFQHCLLRQASTFVAQIHIGSTLVTAVDAKIVIDDKLYRFPNLLSFWNAICEEHELSKVEQDQVLHGMKYLAMMRELYLLDRGCACTCKPQALEGPAADLQNASPA